uniref:ATP-dependent RNA helicase n=1 Tax=Lygus hesperus TaxID=30085 RepID=A0A0A9XVL8_LYGHE
MESVENIVVDETDEMLRMDFFEAINTILRNCTNCQQIVYFSATVSPRIRSCIEQYSPKHVYVDCVQEMNATPHLIQHKMACLPEDKDLPTFILALMMNYSEDGRVMIFIDRKSDVTSLVLNINRYAQLNNLTKKHQDFAAP